MRCAYGLLLLALLFSLNQAQQQTASNNATLQADLAVPEQQNAERRRLLVGDGDGDGDATDALEDVPVAEELIDDRGSLPNNQEERPRNLNRRRRKRKRIQPRPLSDDDDLPLPSEDPTADSTLPHRTLDELPPRRAEENDEDRNVRPRLSDDNERPLRRERPRPSDDDEDRPYIRGRPRPLDNDEDRPFVRERQRPLDADEDRPFIRERPRPLDEDDDRPFIRERNRPEDGEDAPRFRERPYRTNDGSRQQRPLRRRRKNRRRPNLETPVDGAVEELKGTNEFMAHRERLPAVSRDEPDEVFTEGDTKREGEEPVMLRERNRNPEDISLGSLRGQEPMPRSKVQDSMAVTEPVLVDGIQFPGPRLQNAEIVEVVENPVETTSKRPRRRRLRPRVQKVAEEKGNEGDSVAETTTVKVEGGERQLLKLREPQVADKKEEKNGTSVGEKDKEADTKVGSSVPSNAPAPIKISLSDLLREKNLSIADILGDTETTTESVPRPKPKLPITAKQLVRPNSRISKPLLKPRKPENASTAQIIETTTQKLPPTTHKATTTTHKATTTTHKATTTTHKAAQTTRKVTPTTRATEAASVTRMPMLEMQETEEIDPVKMSDKAAGRNNTKAAQFLKTRVRVPPTGVFFPSVKLAKGLKGSGQQNSTTDQEVLASKESTTIVRPHLNVNKEPKKNASIPTPTESNKIPPLRKNEHILKDDSPKLPVYVLNPKYQKSYHSDALPPTETNIIPAPKLNSYGTFKEAKRVTTEPSSEPVRLNIPLKATEPEPTSSETESHVKSAEDEIVELLMAENGSGRLSRILASRNMTLSELIDHRERGASQQRISDIFLGKKGSEETRSGKASKKGPLDIKSVPKLEDLFNSSTAEQAEEEAGEGNGGSKRVPRVFEGLERFKSEATNEPKPEPETKEPRNKHQEELVTISKLQPELVDNKGDVLAEIKYELDTEASDNYPDVEVALDDYRDSYRGNRKIENAGKVREIGTKVTNVEHDYTGLPPRMKSILMGSSAILGLAIFVFLAIFITCKVRRHKRVQLRYASRGRTSVRHHDVEKSRSMSPVLINTGYKDMTQERRYYLWNTIRKTLRYK